VAEPVKFNFVVDTRRMMRAIDTDDDIGAVIRVHFEIDRALSHVIARLVPKPAELSLRYTEARVRLLLALGIPEVRLSPIQVVNRIRNSFAHDEGKETISEGDVRQLEASVSTMMAGRKIPTHFTLRHKSTAAERSWVYSAMTLKEKFCLGGFFIVAGVATLENDFQPFLATRNSDSDFADL
jgi:hypothetical protein